MIRRDLVIATLATAGDGASFTPVQVQKIFFLLDERGRDLLGGPHFSFEPYDYGPFDNAVYTELEILALAGLVLIELSGRYRTFRLTDAGFAKGSGILAIMPEPKSEFIRATVEWVCSLRFDQLVAAIYREYPEMKARSVFRQ
jgi:uncharacterized protein